MEKLTKYRHAKSKYRGQKNKHLFKTDSDIYKEKERETYRHTEKKGSSVGYFLFLYFTIGVPTMTFFHVFTFSGTICGSNELQRIQKCT